MTIVCNLDKLKTISLMNELFMSPSQVHERIQELREKMEFENLSPEEKIELRELKEVLRDLANEFLTD